MDGHRPARHADRIADDDRLAHALTRAARGDAASGTDRAESIRKLAYQGVKGSLRRLRRWHSHLSPAQLKAALLYYERHRDEIDGAIAENVAVYSAGKPFSAPTTRRR